MTAPTCDARPAGTGADLMDRAQTGDRDAYGQLYGRYYDVVFRFIYARTQGNRPLAEDLCQDVFTRALARLDSFTWQGRDPGSWFVTIARNLVADYYKSGRYRFERLTDTGVGAVQNSTPSLLHGSLDGASWHGYFGNLPDTDATPGDAVVDQLTWTATRAALSAALAQLGAEQRQCLTLRFLNGCSVADTATAMGKNEGAIKALTMRAVRSLGRLVPDLGDGATPKPVLLNVRQRRRQQREQPAEVTA